MGVTTTAAGASTTVTTPAAVQTGMVSNCNSFYQAVSGDTCASIASAYGISVSQFEAWNPAVGSDCSGLWLNEYYCESLSFFLSFFYAMLLYVSHPGYI